MCEAAFLNYWQKATNQRKSQNKEVKMRHNFNFFKTAMPYSRKADIYLGCLEGAVFIDFNFTIDKQIVLNRISFDGYGCCDLHDNTKPLSHKASKAFIEEIGEENINQEKITNLVLELIWLNKDNIWLDALEEYNLIDKQ
jgi:hypothetical protein